MNLWICKSQASRHVIGSIHSANSRGSSRQCELSRGPPASLLKAGENNNRSYPACQLVTRNEVAGEFIVGAVAEHGISLRPRNRALRDSACRSCRTRSEFGHLTSTILTTPLGTRCSGRFSAGFEQYSVTVVEEVLHQGTTSRSCSMGSPPVISTSPPGLNCSTSSATSSIVMRCPPVNVYSLSHQEQRRLHPVKRTNTQSNPACVDSP